MTTLLAAITRPILVGCSLVGYTNSLCHPHLSISSESKQESYFLAPLKVFIITKVVLEDAKTTEKPNIGGGGESPSVTAEDIERKLEESQNRRKSLEVSQE